MQGHFRVGRVFHGWARSDGYNSVGNESLRHRVGSSPRDDFRKTVRWYLASTGICRDRVTRSDIDRRVCVTMGNMKIYIMKLGVVREGIRRELWALSLVCSDACPLLSICFSLQRSWLLAWVFWVRGGLERTIVSRWICNGCVWVLT